MDFYDTVNKQWKLDNPIPEGYSAWSNFHYLHDNNYKILKDLIESSDMDNECLNILWQSSFKEYNDNKILFDIDDPFVNSFSINGMYLMDLFVAPDVKNSKLNILHIGNGDLPLPDRDYYITDKYLDKIQHYKVFIENIGKFYNIKLNVNEIYNFEKTLATIILSKTDLLNPEKTYNVYTLETLTNNYPNIPFDKIFSLLNINIDINNNIINVIDPNYLIFLNEFLGNNNKEFLTMYYKYRYYLQYSDYISETSYDIIFDFFGKTLKGQNSKLDKWKRIIDDIGVLIGEQMSKEYVKHYFNNEDKNYCLMLIDKIINTVDIRLKNLTWMSEETKVHALKKLHSITKKIGYPDVWENFDDLKLDKSFTYIENVIYLQNYNLNRKLRELYKPVKPYEWNINAYEINAYYEPSNNEILFPAGILQEPFYSRNYTIAQNLGGIGAIIGHEIIHAFDNTGCKYDYNGNLHDWWTEQDYINYTSKTNELIEIYNKYEYYGININGELTLGENIADLGGLSVAFDCLKNQFSNDDYDIFFKQWSIIWRTNITEDQAKMNLSTDYHSPMKFRVNIILKFFKEFKDYCYDLIIW